jgi:site-specific DNA recombinase
VFQLLGSIAELERETIAERTTLGRVRVARDGRYAGGPIPFGYDLDDDRRLIPSPRPVAGTGRTEAELAADLFHRIAAGSSLHAEAARMNALGVPSVKRYARNRTRGTPETELRIAPRWTPARVWAIIHNPIYKGEGRYRARTGVVPFPAPPLVDAVTWERAQQQLTRNRLHATRNAKHTYLLRLLITCGHCGRRYTGKAGRPRRDGPARWYVCNGAGRIDHGAGLGCPGRAIDADRIEQRVWEECRAFIRNPGPVLAAAQEALHAAQRHRDDHTARRQALMAQCAEKERERARVRTLYRRGAITLAEAEAELATIAQEIATLTALAESLTAQEALAAAETAQLTTAATLLAQLRAELDDIEATDDRAFKHQIITRLVSAITVTTEGTGRQATVIARVRYTFAPTTPADVVVLGRE